MVLILLWQTFPLRYGQLRTLLREFKWTFIALLLFLSTSLLSSHDRARKGHPAQRGSQPGQRLLRRGHLEQPLLHLPLLPQVPLAPPRYICYPVFYGFLLSFSLKVIDPSYYQPERWLK